MTSKAAFTKMADHWDNEALVKAVSAFLGDSGNAISKESAEVEEVSRDDTSGHIRFYINVDYPMTQQYTKDVYNKLPGFKYMHQRVRVIDGSTQYADLKFRTWLEFTPSSNPIISSGQLILFLLSILLFAWAFYALWQHWLDYEKPWKNLVSHFLEEYLTGLISGGVGGEVAGITSHTSNNL